MVLTVTSMPQGHILIDLVFIIGAEVTYSGLGLQQSSLKEFAT